MKHAILDTNGIVRNVIDVAKDGGWSPPKGETLVLCGDMDVSIGDQYNAAANVFIKPQQSAPEANEVRVSEIQVLRELVHGILRDAGKDPFLEEARIKSVLIEKEKSANEQNESKLAMKGQKNGIE